MTIIASAPVPPSNRWTELGRRIDHLFAAGLGDLLDVHARALGSTRTEALAAWEAYRRTSTEQAVIPQPRTSADVLQLGRQVDRLVIGSDLTDAEVAARLGVSVDVAFDALEAYDAERRAGVSADCPPWCSEDHRGQVTDIDGFTLGLVHERVVTEVTGRDPGWIAEHPVTVAVLVESTTEAGQVTSAPRVVLTATEGTEGSYGGEDTQAWTGTPEEAEALAAALLAAARIVRVTR